VPSQPQANGDPWKGAAWKTAQTEPGSTWTIAPDLVKGKTESAMRANPRDKSDKRDEGGCTYAFVWTVVVVWRAEVSNRILKMWEEAEP
jgi:hypothetical protein